MLLQAASGLRRGVAMVAAVMAYLAGWNYLACALFITFDIVARNFFGFSSRATVEVTGYALACGIAWGLAHTLAARAHIRVDVLVNRFPVGIRAPLHLFSLLLLRLRCLQVQLPVVRLVLLLQIKLLFVVLLF